MVLKLNSKQLRAIDANDISSDAKSIVRNPLVFILENIYDTYNIGGIFRLADGLGVSKMYLCGETETPPNNRIHKASCGTYKVVPWEYCKTAQEAVEQYKKNFQFSIYNNQNDEKSKKKGQVSSVPSERIQSPTQPTHDLQPYNLTNLKPCVIAIEQSPISIPYTSLQPSFPLALVVGNETTGVTPETLALCDKTVEIPMWGINKSLNVIVSAAIVSYHLITKSVVSQQSSVML